MTFFILPLLIGLVVVYCWRLHEVWREEGPATGLGDAVAIVLISFGIEGWSGCGCDERRDRWNARWPRKAWLIREVARLREAEEYANDAADRAADSLDEARRSLEAFKREALGFISVFHERAVKDAAPWYVGNVMPMEGVQELLLREGVGFRSLADNVKLEKPADFFGGDFTSRR